MFPFRMKTKTIFFPHFLSVFSNQAKAQCKWLVAALLFCFVTSCSDVFEMPSSFYVTDEENTLSQASDTVYSVIGILGQVQKVADRLVLFGELRADLVDENEYTSSELREMTDNDVSPENSYVDYSDFYAIINNCNYFLSRADTTVLVAGQKVFLKEYAVVTAIRAWTYMQLALIYGEVPFYTEPILKVSDAERDYPTYNLLQICSFFIPQLLPFVDTEQPSYGTIYGIPSAKFFFPVRLVLADMYLWMQDYEQAAQYYASFLAKKELSTGVNATTVTSINSNDEINALSQTWIKSFTNPVSDEIITLIPMATTKLEGTKSELANVFSSTEENDNHYRVVPSASWQELSMAQDYAYVVNARTIKHLGCGDVRQYSVYPALFDKLYGVSSGRYSYRDDEEDLLVNSKYSSGHVYVYRTGTVWLRLAEALNRMGRSTEAFAILKDGCSVRMVGDSLSFTFANTTEALSRFAGIHSRGSGRSFGNDMYSMPDLTDSLTSVLWTPQEVVEYVEDLVVDELALEAAFEGSRFYDLMRVALRRNDPAYLADKIAHRKGETLSADENLRARLINPANWYVRHK